MQKPMSHQPNTPHVPVWVHWVPRSQGGRQILPQAQGGLYYVITPPLPSTLPEPCSWSLVLQITQNDDTDTNGARYSLGYAHFLMDEAPSDLLKPGFTVDIYEGPRKVGLVEVI